ncbi:hypothetical protein BAUCODRAFT_31186, partial [Baudoinia panamericana UAMH 10762]
MISCRSQLTSHSTRSDKWSRTRSIAFCLSLNSRHSAGFCDVTSGSRSTASSYAKKSHLKAAVDGQEPAAKQCKLSSPIKAKDHSEASSRDV